MAIDLSMFFTTNEDGTEIELPRPETKSWPDVIQCMNHWQGKGDAVVNRFIELYLLGLQWDWFESYKDWQQACEKVQEWNDARIPDEDIGELPEPMPEPEMPARPKADTVEQVRLREAYTLREAQYNGYQKQFALLYDSAEDWKAWQDEVKAHYPKAVA